MSSFPHFKLRAGAWFALAGLVVALPAPLQAADIDATNLPAVAVAPPAAASAGRAGSRLRAHPGSSAAAASRASFTQLALPGDSESLVMGVGDIRMLSPGGSVKRIALGSGAYASATTVDGRIMLIGEAPGETSMLVWTDDRISAYHLRVVHADNKASRRVLDDLVSADSQHLSLEEFDTKLVVSGSADKATIDRLSGLQKFMPRLVVNVRENREAVRSVLFRLHFVEVNKSLLESLGIQWSQDAPGPTFGAQGIAINSGIYRNVPQATAGTNLLDPTRPFTAIGGATGGVFLGLATTIASRLKFGAADGDTRLLASPELTAMSGGKARLQVGGEVPIPLAGAFGSQSVEFKPYGIIFNIEPVIADNGSITAKVSTELSQIDPTVSVAGIPGFLTRMTSTEVNVRPGEVIALSGLVSSELSTAIDKVPGLGNVPILGRLFRSDDFRNKRTDLVVLLEPEIVVAGQGMAEALKRKGVDNAVQFENKVRATVEPTTPPRPDPAAAPAVRRRYDQE